MLNDKKKGQKEGSYGESWSFTPWRDLVQKKEYIYSIYELIEAVLFLLRRFSQNYWHWLIIIVERYSYLTIQTLYDLPISLCIINHNTSTAMLNNANSCLFIIIIVLFFLICYSANFPGPSCKWLHVPRNSCQISIIETHINKAVFTVTIKSLSAQWGDVLAALGCCINEKLSDRMWWLAFSVETYLAKYCWRDNLESSSWVPSKNSCRIVGKSSSKFCLMYSPLNSGTFVQRIVLKTVCL